MIGYLKGELLDWDDSKMLLSVQDVGYVVSVPHQRDYELKLSGDRVELFIHSHIREDGFDLYGFYTKLEKAFFLTLLGVNGIGPKSALQMISKAGVSELMDAIVREDLAYLTSIPGIGKKTAERLIVELKDQIRKKRVTGTLETKERTFSSLSSPLMEDAKQALLGLGYKEVEVQTRLEKALSKLQKEPHVLEDLIRGALKEY